MRHEKRLLPTWALIFVPAPFAGDAILEAAEAGIELIICITEGIPTQDMLRVKTILGYSRSRLIGPNCPGILSPDESKAGIMPGSIAKKGSIGVISRSGTLTYEAVQQLVEVGFGQSSCIGIGGDPIIGSSMVELLECFETDQETEAVLLIGEIGGQIEVEAAYYVKNSMCKPVFGFIAGRTAPPGRRMGHAGAIISGTDESAQSKMKIMQDLGIGVIESPAEIGRTVKKGLAECSLVRTSSG